MGLSDAGNNLSPNGVGGLDSGNHFSVGDLVQICSDMERMKVRLYLHIFFSIFYAVVSLLSNIS